MPRCEYCMHYKPLYAKAINRNVMSCELDGVKKKNANCVGDYIPKEDYEYEYGRSIAKNQGNV